MKKPIICVKGQENGFTYKYVHTGYCLGMEIKFSTYLSKKMFNKLLDKGMSEEEIKKFELIGKF